MIVSCRKNFHCDSQTYFKELFNYESREPRETKGRGALSFRVKESDTNSSTWKHKVEFREQIDAPAPVRKLMGETVLVEEEITWTPGKNKAHVTYRPSTLAKKTHISGTLTAEDTENGDCRVTMETEVKIKVFALGSIMEKTASEKLQKDFEKDVTYFNQVLAPRLKEHSSTEKNNF